MQVTVGSKYQIVIPKEVRKQVKGIKPGSKVIVKSLDAQTVGIKTQKRNWLQRTRGMMKEAWKDVDTTKYLDDLRNEWDRKR